MTRAFGLRRCVIGEAVRAGARWCAPTGRSFSYRRAATIPCRTQALFAPMAAPVFAAKALFLRRRGEDLAPLPFLKTICSAGKDLKRPVDLLQLIEAHRAGLVKDLEVGGYTKSVIGMPLTLS